MKKFFVAALIIFMCSGAVHAEKKPNTYDGMGYVGTLPDVTKSFTTAEPKDALPTFEQIKNFHSSNAIKPAPTEDPAFVNIILKTDKTSPYLNDLREFVPKLESILDSIESGENVQRFAARVYYLNTHADYFRDKYTNLPEENYASFQKVMEISLHAKTISQLRTEAYRYTPYMAYQGAGHIYNGTNIDDQMNYLQMEIEQAIAVIKEAN